MISRRVLIGAMAVAAAWPLAARAQPPAMPVIGYLSGGTPEALAHLLSAFREGLAEAGFVEGRNVVIEYRWAAGQNDRLTELAADLVRRKVAAILAQSPAAARAAKPTTGTIPIVFTIGGDPVGFGLVTSIGRPGGNITGATMVTSELVAKRLALLREVIPKAAVIGLLVNPTSPNAAAETREMEAAAAQFGLRFQLASASSEREIDTALASLAAPRVDAMLVGADVFLTARRDQLVALAARHAIPAIYPFREYAAAGGLMSYGASVSDTNRQAGVYVGRILKGAKPAELPILQPTRFETIINFKTAKALGIAIPPAVMQRADEVIE